MPLRNEEEGRRHKQRADLEVSGNQGSGRKNQPPLLREKEGHKKNWGKPNHWSEGKRTRFR